MEPKALCSLGAARKGQQTPASVASGADGSRWAQMRPGLRLHSAEAPRRLPVLASTEPGTGSPPFSVYGAETVGEQQEGVGGASFPAGASLLPFPLLA